MPRAPRQEGLFETTPKSGGVDWVQFYVDTAREIVGSSPPQNVRARYAKEVSKLIKEGTETRHLRLGTRILCAQGMDPSMMPSAVWTAMVKPDTEVVPVADRVLVDQYVLKNGWPTGCSMVRGTHGASYSFDPLGHERCPYKDEGIRRPTRSEILRALKERDETTRLRNESPKPLDEPPPEDVVQVVP